MGEFRTELLQYRGYRSDELRGFSSPRIAASEVFAPLSRRAPIQHFAFVSFTRFSQNFRRAHGVLSDGPFPALPQSKKLQRVISCKIVQRPRVCVAVLMKAAKRAFRYRWNNIESSILIYTQRFVLLCRATIDCLNNDIPRPFSTDAISVRPFKGVGKAFEEAFRSPLFWR